MTNNDIKPDMIYFNGVNGTTGKYDLAPMPVDKFAETMLSHPGLNDVIAEDAPAAGFYQWSQEVHYAPADDRDPKKLKQVGWGVIFAHDEDPAVIEALEPLLTRRREQAGDYYYEYKGDGSSGQEKRWGYFDGETKEEFLERRGAEPFGPVDPKYAPYYLLIVGDPEKIPYKFQYQLDVQYAVGRIHFRTPEEYAQYAQNVVDAETKQMSLPREAVFFGVEHEGDGATQLSANHLVNPLMKQLGDLSKEFELDWTFKSLMKEQASKQSLSTLLNGKQAPALLFTASHGIDFESKDKRLFDHQGALLCHDWPGETGSPRNENYYFSADDLESSANLLGLMAFHFACFSAGTPRENNFLIAHDRTRPPQLASRAFVARLPQRLLLNGALAVIGHIERAWTVSIAYAKDNLEDEGHLAAYRSTMKRLLDGHPVGSALEYFNEKYGEYSSALTKRIEARELNLPDAPSNYELVRLWRGNNDSRNFVIIGDPAARLPVADAKTSASRDRPALSNLALPKTASSQGSPG